MTITDAQVEKACQAYWDTAKEIFHRKEDVWAELPESTKQKVKVCMRAALSAGLAP